MLFDIYWKYLISGNVGAIWNKLLIFEKIYNETVGEMNWTSVTKYSASKFLFVYTYLHCISHKKSYLFINTAAHEVHQYSKTTNTTLYNGASFLGIFDFLCVL